MASLYENMPNLGNFVRNVAPNTGGSTTTLIYILLAVGLIAVVVLMLMNKKIDVSFFNPLPKSTQVTMAGNKFWKPGPTFTNLKVAPSALPSFEADSYSLNFDAVLYNTRNYRTTEGPWRQILHRGSDELAVTTVGGNALAGGCAAYNSGSPLPPFGLPKRMNPGIFLDPNTNDIIVFIDTDNGAESYRESVRIVDIPMDIPFRLGIVINKRVLEVYLNCRLEVTKVLSGDPKKVENTWYGLAGSAAAQAQIQNLYVWKKPLGADEIGSLCDKPPAFDKKRPICEAADEALPPQPSAGTPQPQPVAYGGALKTCGGQ